MFGKEEEEECGTPPLECPQMVGIFQGQQASTWSLRSQSALGMGEGSSFGVSVGVETLREKTGRPRAEMSTCHSIQLLLGGWNPAYFALFMCDI